MSKQSRFIRGNERIKQLAARSDIADGVAHTRREMAEADRAYAQGLAALRKAAALTQAELAERLGVSQAAISQVEQRHDMLLSTLNSYLEGMGGRATVFVEFADGNAVELDLASLTPAAPK